MTPTKDFLEAADKYIRMTLRELRPELLRAHGMIEHELKDDKSVVTKMDLLLEQRLKKALFELDPTIGFSGEETGVDYDRPTFWLADPIDGTEAFIRGLPFATSMIALIDNGQPVMSVIYDFFQDEYYLAMKGRGATCNGHVIHVSNRSLDRSFVVLGGDLVRLGGPVGFREELRSKTSGVPHLHASGIENAYIARGSFDGKITIGRKGAWDFAPGAFLIQEAGGRVENLDTKSYDYRNLQFVAANPVIFDELKQFVLDTLKEQQ